MLIRESPTVLRLVGYDDRIEEVRKYLSFKNSSARFEYERFRKNKWAARSMEPEDYVLRLEELKSAIETCLLFEDDEGYWTYPGLEEAIAFHFHDNSLQNLVEYPEMDGIPWTRVPTKTLRPYQQEAVQALLKAKHGAVELATGGGKSLCILYLIRDIGLKTIVMAPSASIANQLYDEFKEALGGKYVGMFGDGKRKTDKLITVAIAASLTRLKPGTEHWDNLCDAQVFIADESHITPSETFEKVCHGVAANSPYRFFFSATQFRNDGADKLLTGITGEIVYSLTASELIEAGYLAKPLFRMVNIGSSDQFYSDDAQRMSRRHFLYNQDVIKTAAQLANLAVSSNGHQVVILVDEVEQFTKLKPLLAHETRFAHGGLTTANKKKVPAEYHKSNPNELVESFNNKEYPILVGTSCISTGTDIRTVQTIINLQAGKSPIKFQQSVGRGTRLAPGKTEFYFIDFAVRNRLIGDEKRDLVYRHSQERAAIYAGIYPTVQYLEL